MARHFVSELNELPEGTRKVMTVGAREIGVFNVDGHYYALRNMCPHRGAPLSCGQVTGTMESDERGCYEWLREGEILRCPWHGWEFELKSGRALRDQRMRVQTYPVTVENEQVFVEL